MSSEHAQAIGGTPVTWVGARIWNETAFRYDDVVLHFLGDLTDLCLSQHDPPLLLVRFARFENQQARTPHAETEREAQNQAVSNG